MDGHAITSRSRNIPYVIALMVPAVALRLFASKRIFRGISAGRWAAFLGAAASAIKLVEVSIRVVRKQVPAGHILLPAIILDRFRIVGQRDVFARNLASKFDEYARRVPAFLLRLF